MEIVRGSNEDGERENERSIFNMVVPTRVRLSSRTRDFFSPDECTCIETVSISAAFHSLCACHRFANNYREWELDQT